MAGFDRAFYTSYSPLAACFQQSAYVTAQTRVLRVSALPLGGTPKLSGMALPSKWHFSGIWEKSQIRD
jgi:hypothetical protein